MMQYDFSVRGKVMLGMFNSLKKTSLKVLLMSHLKTIFNANYLSDNF